MDPVTLLADFVIHLDSHLGLLIQQYGIWVYLILFLVVFLETGVVVTPFLPGDSLLFVAGTFAGLGSLDPLLLFGTLSVAAVLGDTVNYWIGYHMGPRVFREKRRLLKKEYLDRSEKFYERHGGKTIFLARFIPIVRTFAPFVAGIGKMRYWRFLAYNIAGGVTWVGAFIMGGYLFGNIPAVKDNLFLVIVGIIIISFVPAVIGAVQHKRKKSHQAKT